MKRQLISCGALLTAVLGVGCGEAGVADEELSSSAAEPIIFGTDSRTEYLNITDPKLKLKADATAALVGAGGISCNSSNCSLLYLSPYSQGEVQTNPSVLLPLCDGVRFKDQLGEPHCTAFLVGADTFMTAGHCVASNGPNSPMTCTDANGGRTRAVFGFHADASGNSPGTFPASEVYSCMSIQGKWTSTEDWAVFKVDRPVTGRTAMIVQHSDAPGTLLNHDLVQFGHGFGLPLKMSTGAKIKTDSAADLIGFAANSDIFTGNSGGPGVDPLTGLAVGVVVTGPNLSQHVSVSNGMGGQCAVPRTCPDAGGCPYYNGYTRSTYITKQATSVIVPLHPALVSSITPA